MVCCLSDIVVPLSKICNEKWLIGLKWYFLYICRCLAVPDKGNRIERQVIKLLCYYKEESRMFRTVGDKTGQASLRPREVITVIGQPMYCFGAVPDL